MGLKSKICLVLLLNTACFNKALAYDKAMYECLTDFNTEGLLSEYSKSSSKSYIADFKIKRATYKGQKVFIARFVDPYDEVPKVLLVTKRKSKVCDLQKTTNRCSDPTETDKSYTVARHISILPDVYRESLMKAQNYEFPTNSEGESIDLSFQSVISSLNSCRRVSKLLNKRILNKYPAVESVYNSFFASGVDDSKEDEVSNTVSNTIGNTLKVEPSKSIDSN